MMFRKNKRRRMIMLTCLTIISSGVISPICASANIYQVDGYYKGATYVRTLLSNDKKTIKIEKCDIGYEDVNSDCRPIGHRTNFAILELTNRYHELKKVSGYRWGYNALIVVLGCFFADKMLAPMVAGTTYASTPLATGLGLFVGIPTTIGGTAITTAVTAIATTPKYSADGGLPRNNYQLNTEAYKTKQHEGEMLNPLEVSNMADALQPIIQARDFVTINLDKFIGRLTVVLDELDFKTDYPATIDDAFREGW